MASRNSTQVEITPEVLLKAYACGIFPMAENADDPALYWIEPELRGIIPLDTFHVPARLARTVRAEPFTVVCNRDFEAVVEAYDGSHLVGGLYGVSLGRTFFGESMFHRARDASKVALVHLVARLRAGGFRLLDTQFVTPHLKSFGATEVHRRQYHKMLADALVGEADFAVVPLAEPLSGDIALARATGHGER